MNEKFGVKGFGSAAIHEGNGEHIDHAHQVPIFASSTYVFDSAEQGMKRFAGTEEGFVYSRWGNPTIKAAEDKIAALEGFGLNINVKALLHASGMAAISTLFLSLLRSGDKVLTHFSLYGGTDDFLRNVLPANGIETIFMDLSDASKAEEVLQNDPAIRLLYLETPANPTIRIVDIEALTGIAKNHGVLVGCDNTFATPYLQQPFRFGVDYIVHSTTKFLNGHGTAIGGVLLGKDEHTMNGIISKTHRLLGGNANSFDAFLLIQGIKTLELRMERHCSNAMEVAKFLTGHPGISKVNYEGLPSHPGHDIAKKQMKKPGGMLSFELKNGLQAGIDFMNRLKMCTRTVSLGTVDTLLCHPASMTHYSVPKEEKEKYGITDGLIRMSVGIENIDDILADLAQAIN